MVPKRIEQVLCVLRRNGPMYGRGESEVTVHVLLESKDMFVLTRLDPLLHALVRMLKVLEPRHWVEGPLVETAHINTKKLTEERASMLAS